MKAVVLFVQENIRETVEGQAAAGWSPQRE
jgi:hypothetical protein